MASEDGEIDPRKKDAMDRETTLDLVMDKAAAFEVFSELFELLEDYAPTWYGEDLHHRAEAALRALRDAQD
jgi:hypothetical protein